MYKKLGIAIVLIFQMTSVYSQDWNLFLQNEYANYDSTKEQRPITIWADSIVTVDETSTVYFNRLIQKCMECFESTYLRNQTNLIGDSLIIENQKSTLYKRGNKYVFYPNEPTGFEWIIDSTANITAQITDLYTTSLFDQIDSVKQIVLSTSDTILLSRSFGLIRLDDPETQETYSLVGLEKAVLGEQIPKFKDYFDFNVGDVFQYRNVCSGGENIPYYYDFKREVISKKIEGDSILYEFMNSGISYEIGIGNNTSYGEPNIFETIYIDSIGHPANAYAYQLIEDRIDIDEFVPFWTPTFLLNDNQGNYVKSIGQDINDNYPYPVALEVIPSNDTLINTYMLDGFNRQYEIGLGETRNYYWIFEAYCETELIGYFKGIDTIGTIYDDTYYTVNTQNILGEQDIFVFPNPTKNEVFLSNIEWIDMDIAYYNLYDQNGKLVSSNPIQSNKINLENINAGLYILELVNGIIRFTEQIIVMD